MWEGSYASEPFDLRLTILRMMRNLGRIVLFTLAGTLIFGGGYYVKNVLLGEGIQYEMTITCKMEYTNPPVQSGDYYINDMTWNTYVDSEDFRKMLNESVTFISSSFFISDLDTWTEHEEGLAGALNATVASDIHVPSITVSTPVAGKTEFLCQAVQEVLVGSFAESIPEVASIRIIDVSEVTPVKPDVRPLRAIILSAVLSFFFVMVFFLIREISADSIWLPATLRRRYGLSAVGTVNSKEFVRNLQYVFQDQFSVAVCSAHESIDANEVIKALQERKAGEKDGEQAKEPDKDWIAVNSPMSDEKSTVYLHGADGVLLVVKAGLHTGKPLEYLLEYFAVQDVKVTAAVLWDADERLIRSYYLLPDGQK